MSAEPPAKRRLVTTASFDSLKTWLIQSGARNLEHLELRPSALPGGQTGLFSLEDIPSGEICEIPQSCVLSHHRAQAELNLPPSCPPDLHLFVYMALGRTDASHPLNLYLRSLPTEPQGLPSWPASYHSLVAGTSLAQSLSSASTEVSSFAKLAASYGLDVSEEDILWAYDMYYSRRYPMALVPHLPQTKDAGVLVPFLDRLNHVREQRRPNRAHVGGGSAHVQPSTCAT
jgi:hypothetical protein